MEISVCISILKYRARTSKTLEELKSLNKCIVVQEGSEIIINYQSDKKIYYEDMLMYFRIQKINIYDCYDNRRILYWYITGNRSYIISAILKYTEIGMDLFSIAFILNTKNIDYYTLCIILNKLNVDEYYLKNYFYNHKDLTYSKIKDKLENNDLVKSCDYDSIVTKINQNDFDFVMNNLFGNLLTKEIQNIIFRIKIGSNNQIILENNDFMKVTYCYTFYRDFKSKDKINYGVAKKSSYDLKKIVKSETYIKRTVTQQENKFIFKQDSNPYNPPIIVNDSPNSPAIPIISQPSIEEVRIKIDEITELQRRLEELKKNVGLI